MSWKSVVFIQPLLLLGSVQDKMKKEYAITMPESDPNDDYARSYLSQDKSVIDHGPQFYPGVPQRLPQNHIYVGDIEREYRTDYKDNYRQDDYERPDIGGYDSRRDERKTREYNKNIYESNNNRGEQEYAFPTSHSADSVAGVCILVI